MIYVHTCMYQIALKNYEFSQWHIFSYQYNHLLEYVDKSTSVSKHVWHVSLPET